MSTKMLALQFVYTYYSIKTNLEGFDHEQSLQQPEPAGNCANWVLGHITGTRSEILEMLGAEPIWTTEQRERYKRSSDPVTDGTDAVDFGELMADYDRSQEAILAALKEVPEEQLAADAPFSLGAAEKETVESLLYGLVFHEAYHAGQTGLARRLLGHEGAIK